jgi:hypothetical protein
MAASASATRGRPAHSPARVRVRLVSRNVGRGRGTLPPPDAGTTIPPPIAGHRLPRADHHHEMYTVRAPAPARARGPRSGVGACWVRGGGLLAMSVAGTVEGAAQDRTPPLCARAALGLGHPLGPDPDPGPALALGLSVGLVPAHVPARAPHRTLLILGDAVGPDPIAGAVEAIAEMILGTADLARLIPKIHDSRMIRLHAFCCAS